MIESSKKYSFVTTMLLPWRVVISEKASNAQVLLEERSRQAVLWTQRESCMIEDGGFVVLDFGEEIQGGAVITIQDAPADAKIRLTFGESVSEAMSSIGEKNAVNDHSPRDFVMPAMMLSNFRAGNTGFRFLKIEAVGASIGIRGVQAVYEHCGLERRGSFMCSDERINRIWDTAAKTVYLCMQEYIWDGIKRDRLVWLGDMHPEISVVCSVFGDAECVPKSLDLGRDETPGDLWINGFASYSFQWIRCQYLWYMQNGDVDYLREQKDYLAGLVRRADKLVKENGEIEIEDKFVDWSARDTEFEASGLRAVMMLAIDEAGHMLHDLGETELEAVCKGICARLLKMCEPYSGNKQITAMCALAGLCDAAEANEIILQGGAQGLSTFMGYYTLQAISKAGQTARALELMREYWGAMLDFGATTFWEDFDISWTKNAARIDEPVPDGKADLHADFGRFCYTNLRHSFCHGWAGGPAAYLAKAVLGVEILEPGCKKVRIKPDLGGLEFAQGSYPTPFGEIKIKHTNKDGKIVTEVSAPDGVEIVQD